MKVFMMENNFLDAESAKSYGIVDSILEERGS